MNSGTQSNNEVEAEYFLTHRRDREPDVAILLCTHNGSRFLGEQIASIEAQSHKHWKIWVSDDHSVDDTKRLLSDLESKLGRHRIAIFSGPNNGYAENFLSLICRNEIQAKYYFFADQDDVWEPNKIARAIDHLVNIPAWVPALYCAKTLLVDDQNAPLRISPSFCPVPSFANALVQSLGSGNTMAFNNASRVLMSKAGSKNGVAAHDWWTYLVISGCGGEVLFDPLPSVRYRQHDSNAIGATIGSKNSSITRLAHLKRGGYRKRVDSNLLALGAIETSLTSANRGKYNLFKSSRKANLLSRMIGFQRVGIHRQSVWENMGLLLGAIFNRI